MPIPYLRPHPTVSLVGSSRVITIPTSPATEVLSIPAAVGMAVFNVGPSAIAWGSGSITQGTGGLLFYSMQKEWMLLADTISVFFIADSVAGVLAVQDYY